MLFVKDLILPDGFIPRGFCCFWTWSLIGLYAVSDSLLAIFCPPILITLAHQVHETFYAPAFQWLPVDQPSLRQAMNNRMEKCA
jgi:hypothetical protein